MASCFAEAVAGRCTGLGFVLHEDDGFACVDLDHCIANGVVEEWAMEIVRSLNSYTEISPSGKGLHIWVRAEMDVAGRRHGKVEIYSSKRYITVTADHLAGTPETINEASAAIDALIESFPKVDPATIENGSFQIDSEAEPPAMKYAALIRNEPRFLQSWDHTRRDLKDQTLSSYDMSLATIAAYADWTDQEIVNLLITHRRENGSLKKGMRPDYLQRTLARARQAVRTKIKDFEAAEVHRVEETREVEQQEGLAELSTLLAIGVQRVVQRGRDPASYAIQTERHGEIHIGNGEMLLSANKARARLIESSGIYLPHMSRKQWERIVALVVRLCEFEEIAEGQRGEEVKVWLSSYLKNHPCTEPEDKDQLAKAIDIGDFPLRWEGNIYIRTPDLREHIFSGMGEKSSVSTLCTRLRAAGFSPEQLQVRTGEKIVKARTWLINRDFDD